MDTQKDNKIVLKDSSTYGFIGDNEYKKFLLKKTEKLVGVLYMVSKFFPAQDIVADSLKKESIGLLSFVNTTVISSQGWSNDAFEKVKQYVANLISLLGVARLSGFISEMNYSIILPELQGLVEVVQEQVKEGLVSIAHDLFTSQEKSQKAFSSKSADIKVNHGVFNKRQKEYSKGHIKDTIGTGEKRQDRRGIIVDFFKTSNRPLSIKDIAFSIKDCSEKTIQRELVSMVSEGVLKKEGERRWSRYTLI